MVRGRARLLFRVLGKISQGVKQVKPRAAGEMGKLRPELMEVWSAPYKDASLLKHRLKEQDALFLCLHARLHRLDRSAGALFCQHALRHLYERRLLPRLLN